MTHLTTTEQYVYDALKAGGLVTKDDIAARWGAIGASDNQISVAIYHLRKKRPDLTITCYHGHGYRLDEPQEGFDTATVRKGDMVVRLSPTQSMIMRRLCAGPVQADCLMAILECTYDNLMVHICQLRRRLHKIGMGVEHTSQGYCLA